MAVEHQVWFKFRPEISEERIAHHVAGLSALEGKIAGITALKVGMNFTDRSQGHQLGLAVTFTDQAALEAYGPHAEHQAVAKPLAADCDSVMAVDFEF